MCIAMLALFLVYDQHFFHCILQLPVSSSSAGVSIVRQYERALFGTTSAAGLLKSEMGKVRIIQKSANDYKCQLDQKLKSHVIFK